jgi:hypothetical protein
MKTTLFLRLGLLAFLRAVVSTALADNLVLVIDDPPPDGLVLARVDLAPAAQFCQKFPASPGHGLVAQDADGNAVDLEFVPEPEFDGRTRMAGTIVLRLPKPGPARLLLTWTAQASPLPRWDGVVHTPNYSVSHDPKRLGGFPWRIAFDTNSPPLQALRWNNRVHHRQTGSWCVGDDSQASVARMTDGPICAVVRVQGHFVQAGKRPPSEPSAVYDWYYFRDCPLVFVQAAIRQEKAQVWHELHFLEMDYPRETFPRWAGGEPLQAGQFQDTKKSFPCAQWGVVHDGHHGFGMFDGGQVLLYDGGSGTYIQAHGDAAWQAWQDLHKEFSTWLWIGASDDPALAVQALGRTPRSARRVLVSTGLVRARIEAAARQWETAQPEERPRLWWQRRATDQLESQGRLKEAVALAEGRTPTGWTVLQAGELGTTFETTSNGIRLLGLVDTVTGQQLAAATPVPLFTITLRHTETKEEVRLTADTGWGQTQIGNATPGPAAADVEFRWQAPADKRLGDLRVIAKAAVERARHRLRWRFSAQGQAAPWGLWRVVFPALALAEPGPQGVVLFPKGAGEVQRGVWRRPFRFTGTYPSGWTTMQFMAAYGEDLQRGFYLGMHDPFGSTKDLICESRPQDASVVLACDHPVPEMGAPGNHFELCGEGIWQLLRGDWFDAAVTYREWVRQEARWYPRLSAEGREDTPLWTRQLSAWSLGGGRPQDCVGSMKSFAQFLTPPIGFHWYNWHQIPFDNDYPHYFPAQPGFAAGVREVQSAGVFAMPYINGRLWDTHDREAEDFEFTKVARAAVSKDEKGEPYLESYGSKEKDGSPVRLGVMCPSTPLWQEKIRGIVLQLMNECGVQGVYIDQIAAAAPTLCFDKSHGHPLGGGHWWTESYWKLLDGIRQAKPQDRMITTECNGEPYIRWLDGYLTWHWQYDGQVPAFPAVYGGAVQMFGRSYGGGGTKSLALRMKTGQALVFGEQLGWINPGLALEKENAGFFKDAVHLRRQLERYFYAGEMARPPRLANLPTVRADWQWQGTNWVTTDAVLTGAWHLPAARRLALMFVNVSDQPVKARLNYDARPYGFTGEVKLSKVTPTGPGETFTSGPLMVREMVFPPQEICAWEINGP